MVIACLPALWWSLTAAPQLRVDVGAWGDHAYLSGINAVEQSSTEQYRWTTGRAELVLPNLSDAYRLLRLRSHGWRPDGAASPRMTLYADSRLIAVVQSRPEMRISQVLLPRATGPTVRVGIASEEYQPPGDDRVIGVAIDWIELGAFAPGNPGFWQFAGQALLLALLALLVGLLGLPPAWRAAAAGTLLGVVLWANLTEPLWVGAALGPWLAITLGLTLATVWVGLWMRRAEEQERRSAGAQERARTAELQNRGTDSLSPAPYHLVSIPHPWMTPAQARVGWALLVLALGLRLAGAVHPLFNAHDVDVHTRWLDTVAAGDWYLYSTPSEARNRQIFNPPAGYALLLPLGLALPSTRLVVQVGVALVDASGCLLLLLLARELGISPQAGLVALGLYLALPLNTTILWWGFSANLLAQTLWLLLLWLVLRMLRAPSARAAALVGAVAAAGMMTHIGATLLATATLVFLLALLALRRLDSGSRSAGQRAPATDHGPQPLAPGSQTTDGGLRTTALVLAVTMAGLVLLYFSAAAAPLLASADEGIVGSRATPVERLGVLTIAAPRAFTPLLLILLPLGIVLLLAERRHRSLVARVVLAWGGGCLLFLVIHMTTGMLTRYLYFAVPLVCLVVGALLAHFLRGGMGRVAVLAVVGFTAWGGVVLWVQGVLMRIKPSGLPLSH